MARAREPAKLNEVKHEITHDLDLETAKKVARKAVESYEARFKDYGFETRWKDDTYVELEFNVKGKRLDGSLKVEPSKLVFQMDVPLLFRVFTGKATEIIERETRSWIDRAKAGELDAAE